MLRVVRRSEREEKKVRKIDGKFAAMIKRDNVEIVKTSNGEIVPHDEPLFLIRGRDHLAVNLLRVYLAQCESDDCTQWQIDSLKREIDRFEKFAREHPERMKQPGITEGK